MRNASDGVRFGSAVRADRFASDPTLRRAVIEDCDWIAPEIDFKWNALEYRRDAWWFKRADALAEFSKASDKPLRGHTLLWDQSTPQWAKADLAKRANWDIVERWISTVVPRYRAQVIEWDVVNEPIDTEDGENDLRRNCFQRAFGNSYVAHALRRAHAHSPDAHLLINEYSLEYANPVERDRRHAVLRLAESLLAEGAPLHGIGLQAHLDLAKGPLDIVAIQEMLREIEDLGLTVTVTELDVKESDRSQSIERRDWAIADEVARYLDIVLASKAVRGVVTWGISDRYSWLQDAADASGPELNRGLPRDEEFARKPLYWTLRRAIGESSPNV